MKTENFFEAFTELDDDLIENALPKDNENTEYDIAKPALKIHSWKPWVAGVAVAAAAFGITFAGVKLFGSGGIGSSPAHGLEDSSAVSAAVGDAKYGEMIVDWVIYNSAEELVENSDIICKAKVNDITFALIDPKTGKEIEDGDDPKNGELYTIYDIYLTKVYKSDIINKGRLWFRVMGGIKGYKTDEQLEVLKRTGSDTITVMHEPPEIELGEEYLFLLTRENGFSCLTNAPQGVFPLSNPAYRDDFSGASAQDIIDCVESGIDLSSIVYADKLENENPHYSAEEIVNNEDVICTGTVTNISFAVLDLDTCLPPTENSVDYKVNLFTIYDIELKNSYKGNVAKKFKLIDIGGIKGYKVGEQLRAIGNEYLKGKTTIPVWSDPPEINIGEEYLFIMRHSDIEKPCFFGHHKQTALPLSDSTFRDEYSGASVKDIINCAQNTAAVDNYMEISIMHDALVKSLSDTERHTLAAAVQNALANDCLPDHQLNRVLSDQDFKQYGKTGYAIDLIFSDTDAPLVNGGSNKKAQVLCHATVLIGAENESSYIEYSYTILGANGSTEQQYGGTYNLSATCREHLLGCIDECNLPHTDSCMIHHNNQTSHHEDEHTTVAPTPTVTTGTHHSEHDETHH